MPKSLSICAVVTIALLGHATADAQTLAYDHVHLSAPDPAKAADWYAKHMGGTRVADAPQVMFGQTRFSFRQAEAATPSAGTVIDHIGFSFADLDAKLAEWRAAGIATSAPQEVAGLFKLAFIEDPWGVRIEVVQDLETPGFHHIHLRATDPETMFTWLRDAFGGEPARMKGRLDALRYPDNVWVLVQKVNQPPAPSRGAAIDHLGWRTDNLERTAALLKTKDVTFTEEPRAAGAARVSFVEGPDGLRVEVLQRP
jgi:catechol 2,3-dioxygenase-like lactoylglutathione lyase family enzyme